MPVADLGVQGPRGGSELDQDPRGQAVASGQAEGEVLGADVPVVQGDGLAQRELDALLRARREGDVTGEWGATAPAAARAGAGSPPPPATAPRPGPQG